MTAVLGVRVTDETLDRAYNLACLLWPHRLGKMRRALHSHAPPEHGCHLIVGSLAVQHVVPVRRRELGGAAFNWSAGRALTMARCTLCLPRVVWRRLLARERTPGGTPWLCGNCAHQLSHTTGRSVFRIRRLDEWAVSISRHKVRWNQEAIASVACAMRTKIK